MKKCPPGIICVENITLVFLVIAFIIIGYVLQNYLGKPMRNRIHDSRYNSEKIIVQNIPPPSNNMFGIFQNPAYSYSNIPDDVYLNPYAPPAQQDTTMIPPPLFDGYGYGGRVPVNISTNVGAVNANYRQVGILTPIHGSSKDNILPLMGRPVNTSRQKYQYYTISNQHNNVKLPIIVKGRNGTTEYGVDELFSGDRVFVEGNNEPYKVTAYTNDTIQYIPYL